MRRLANESDFESVYSIYMHEEVVPFLGFDPLPREAFAPVFAALLACGSFFVVELRGGVSGFYRATRQEGRALHVAGLATLAVSPEARGSGLAVSMITEAIEELRKHGVRRVELTLEADNPRALAFYKKLGFVHEGTLRAAYKRAGQPEYIDELLLAKLLEPLPGGGYA